MKTTKQILVDARAIIDTPNKWRQGKLATDKDNQPVPFYSNKAERFCSVGAIYRATGSEYITPSRKAITALFCSIPLDYDSVYEFNDDTKTTHSDVLRVFDLAIEACND